MSDSLGTWGTGDCKIMVDYHGFPCEIIIYEIIFMYRKK